jgi:hypothetical protein
MNLNVPELTLDIGYFLERLRDVAGHSVPVIREVCLLLTNRQAEEYISNEY